jgi:mono/diheme cytochrome c family protein
MRITSLISLLVVGVFLAVTPAYAVGHHGHTLAAGHVADQGKPHGEHGAATIPTPPNSHWSAPAAERKRENPVAMSPEGLMEAGELFRENCAACRGTEGLGNGPLAKELEHSPANLFAMAPRHADGDLHWKVAKGRGEMPGWDEVLSDAQIWMLVHYMKSLPAYHIAKRPDAQ